METTKLIRNAVMTIPLLALAACGQASPETRSDTPIGLIAMTTPATDVPGAARPGLAPAHAAARIPEDVLRDPAQRFSLMERLRTEIVHKTRQVPAARWHNEVRPVLQLQLQDAGLSRGDVDFLLWEIDQARPPSAD